MFAPTGIECILGHGRLRIAPTGLECILGSRAGQPRPYDHLREKGSSSMKKVLITIIALTLILSACSPLNAEQRDAVRAFGDLLSVLPPEGDGRSDSGLWRITAPDGSAWFEWTNQEVVAGVDPRPFISAGLDSVLDADTPTLIFIAPGFNMLNMGVQPTPLRQFEKDAGFLRDRIGYDAQTDRYSIDLGEGNRFEWARDMQTNANDIVFSLNWWVFLAPGEAPNAVEGWEYDQAGGRFVKAFDLR